MIVVEQWSLLRGWSFTQAWLYWKICFYLWTSHFQEVHAFFDFRGFRIGKGKSNHDYATAQVVAEVDALAHLAADNTEEQGTVLAPAFHLGKFSIVFQNLLETNTNVQ